MKIAIRDFQSGNHDDAIAKFEALLIQEPKNADLLYNYGCILGELELYEKEQKLYKAILDRNPDDIEALINLSVSLNASKNYNESIFYADRAIQINTEIYQAYEVRGLAKIGKGNIKEGIEDLKKWINLLLKEKKNVTLITFLEDCLDLIDLPPIYQNEAEIDNVRRKIEKKTNSLIERMNFVRNAELAIDKIGKKVAFKLNQFYLAYQQRNDRDLNEKLVKILIKLLGPNKNKWVPKKEENQNKKKIGIISTFQFHPKLFIFDQIASIDQSKYEIEIIVINNKNFFNINTNYHIEYCTLKAENYDEIIHKIRDKNYKIIFIPDIGMSIVSKILATQKLAEMTVTSWLHPITSGSNNVDIFLSGSLMEKDNSQSHYTEQLILLPGIGLKINPQDYLNNDNKYVANIKTNSVKIGCIQTPFKYHPKMDEIFIGLAKKIPNSEFIFIKLQDELDEKLINRIKRNFKKNNLDEKRIKIFDRMEKIQYKNFLTQLDIAIDSLGWSGGNTTLDLIGAGIPSLTIEGEFMRANHTAGIYKMIGMNELIFKNTANLIESATNLVNNQHKLIELKRKLINQFSNLKTESYISNFFNSLT